MKRANSEAIAKEGKRLCAQQHTLVADLRAVSRRETLFHMRSKVRGKKQIVPILT
jgi:anthranilate/para-aminobenzoate synthase component I